MKAKQTDGLCEEVNVRRKGRSATARLQKPDNKTESV